MNAVRRSPAKARRPWLHYVAAAAVLLFLIIGGLQLFQRDPAPDLSSLEAAIEAQDEDVDLEYRGEVAIERAGEPVESLPCQFITGPDRFYVKSQFPSPMGSIPIEFGALDGQRWVNIMGFAIDASRLEEGLSRMEPMAGVGRHSPRGLVDPMRLLTDLGALLRRMRETCDVEVSDGGVAEDGERLTRVLGTPRDPHDAHAVQSIEVFVGRTSDVVKSFTIVCVPPKGPIAEGKPTPGADDRRSRFRERLRQRRSHQLSVQHVTLTCRLVRTFRAERTLFLPAELDASPEADPGDDGPGEDGGDQKR
jgi:hypothetical protein